MLFFGKKQGKGSRESTSLYKKQQSYHYSANRSNSGKVFNRETSKEDIDSLSTTKNLKLSNLPGVLSLLLIIFGVAYMVSLSSDVEIQTTNSDVAVVGNIYAIKQKTNEYLDSNINNKVKPLLDEEDIEKKLLDDFPELNSVDIRVGLLQRRAKVEVAFSAPTLLLLTDNDRLFMVTENGRILQDITDNKPEDFDYKALPLVKDAGGLDLSVGSQALTSAQVEYIKEIEYQTKSKKINTAVISLPPGGGELFVKYSGDQYYVKYNFFEDPRQSSGAYISIRQKISEGSVKQPAEYVDLRVSERAYIK